MGNGSVSLVIGNSGQRRDAAIRIHKDTVTMSNIVCGKKLRIGFLLQIVNRADRRYPKFETGGCC
jgi:hypothetical protein